jgi:hypothetical protein
MLYGAVEAIFGEDGIRSTRVTDTHFAVFCHYTKLTLAGSAGVFKRLLA